MRVLTHIGLTGASLMALAAPAYGQSNEAALDDGLANTNEIVVSARRRDESVQDVPQTVNVVTAEQVEKLNLRNFQEIQSIVPGLTLTQTNSFSSQATVRGVAFVPEASGNNPSVEFYLNDAPISSGFLFQSTFDFGQFELQRGPQGTLRGRASPSGSIAVRVRRPDLSEAGMVVNGTLTNRHARKVDGALNIPIIRDVLGIRLAGVIDETRGNFVRTIKEASDPANNEGPYRKTQSIRGSLRFQPTDWIEANVMYQKLHAEDHSHAQVVSDSLINPAAPVATTPIIRAFDRLSLQDQGAYGRQDHQVLIGNLDIRFAGQKLSYVGSYNKQTYGSMGGDDADYFAPPRVATVPRVLNDPAGYAAVCQTEGRRAGFKATTGAYFQCTSGVGKRESHELRLASDERIGGIFDYVVGVFYDHNNNPTNLTQETPIVIGGNVAVVSLTAIQRTGHSTEKSGFGNLTAHLMDDRLELSGGLRYIDYKSDSMLRTATPPGALAVLTNQVDKDNATVYNASIKYKFSDEFMVYALTGSSWRPGPRAVGNFSLRVTPRELSFTDLPPEKSKSYEVGLKTSFAGGRGRFNLAAYYQDFTNYPFRGPGVNYLNYTNVGGVVTPSVGSFNFLGAVPVRVKGIEAEASFQILDRWSIGGNIAYADGKIKNGTIACNDLNGDGIPDANAVTPSLAQLQAALPAGQNVAQCAGVNRRSINTPKLSANLQSEFGFDIGVENEGFLRGSATLFGKTQNDPDNGFDDVGAYGLLNLFAGVRDRDGAWEVSLFAKNLLNERQVLAVGSGPLTASVRTPAPITYTSQYRSVSVTAPREIGVSARIAIGSR